MVNKLLQKLFFKFNSSAKVSYSQNGEDLIIKSLFEILNKKNPTYLDIGAHHPFYLSNTALLYASGSRGVNIEPDSDLWKNFTKWRVEDINLNLGIGQNEGEQDFYLMSIPSLNTFSKEEAERSVGEGFKIRQVKKIKVENINRIINKYFKETPPDFISIDVEGLDEQILQSLDLAKNGPMSICVETLTFSASGNSQKKNGVIQFLKERGYKIFADTYINTIFVKENMISF